MIDRDREVRDALLEVGMEPDAPLEQLIRHHRNNAGAAGAIQANTDLLRRLKPILSEALTTDGDHHKQWYLEQIVDIFHAERVMPEHEPGIAP